ncbi:hypothetical protein FA15DRAFT_278954 [Coprinopsis marcescibilis]|uniref:Smr domain-containing protein n=1 Tax=Coprinopsis marcescibilis TaxID=230819 RepID=A0A5C3L0U2_COPMA|nr:hypothetical protein FA15DRAFT_278954 [Coprinopsis marcescibilis]
MDIAASVIAGLSLRAFFLGADTTITRISPALVGMWEGIVVHQLSSRSGSEVDHYLALGVRMAVDHLVSRDPARTAMIVIWTAIGYIASESISPASSLRPKSFKTPSRREHRRRSSRSLPSRVRVYQTPVESTSTSSSDTITSSNATILSRLPPPRPSTTPHVPVHRPPSPPSIFLHNSELLEEASPIPAEVHPLELSPTRPPNGLASRLEEAETPSPKPGHLPTPPQSVPSENIENNVHERENATPQRLSTIPELPSADEMSPNHPGSQHGALQEALARVSETRNGTPAVRSGSSSQKDKDSRPESPLPVPNMTMQGFAMSDAGKNDMDPQTSTPYTQALPVPVPNFTTTNWRPPRGPPSELLSPLSDGPMFDELRTPPREFMGGSGEISDDPLRTPPSAHSPLVLSPLVMDEHFPSSSMITRTFGQPVGFQPFAAPDPLDLELDLEPTGSVPGSMPSPVTQYLPQQANTNDPPSDPETLLSQRTDASSVLTTRSPKKLTRKAEQLRQDAREIEKELVSLRNEYRTAIQQGRSRDALVIKGKIADLEEDAANLHKSAAKRYYASLNDYNPKKRAHTIDVHGLRPSEALKQTEKALLDLLNAGNTTTTCLKVIVGKGLHSVNGQPVLKQTILAAMQRQKIPCMVDAKNAGVLVLTLPS